MVLEEQGAHVGGAICLHMPEMGVRGQAEVLAINACPPLESGEGRLITGTFRHTSGEVYDLKLEGETKPIGVTGSHPFWSVDRGDWVAVVDLQVGEMLKTLEVTTHVEWLEKRQNDEPVFNLEVEHDHCYRVGEKGILVHNASGAQEGEVTILYCSCADALVHTGVRECTTPLRSGDPHTACKQCNPECPNCKGFDKKKAASKRDYFADYPQTEHWDCAPDGNRSKWRQGSDWEDSIVCGLCCQERVINGDIHVWFVRGCVCQGK